MHCSSDVGVGDGVIDVHVPCVACLKEKARKAMDYLWQQRHRGSDLMGTIINVHSGDWIRRGQLLLFFACACMLLLVFKVVSDLKKLS